ncbi:uncharacterized protein EAE97_007214 [Botrytis byssoidea]|uniref:Mucin-7 protein n=1 Tax=Botrytis byssoidea TaxID=139641 RepID=A0A9P5IEX9_9HELO|nr:uncharacterized protein EAE97_007214 [Botrytis byssoidea]KAF7939133.1 hypothetical protein EAE97_007214 [Botrytis byssoidea]
MSNIKNLRAMFEQNNKETSASPPDRGRSSGEYTLFSPGSSTTPPRPLSKVRTSFVTVERGAQQAGQAIQLGLKRQDSNSEPNMASGGSMARRRTSFSLDEQSHPKETAERKKSISEEFEARKASIMVDELIPESALAETPAFEVSKQIGDPEPTKQTTPERGRELAKPAEIKENPKKSEEESKALNTSPPATRATKSPTSKTGPSKTNATPKVSDKATRTKSATRPAPISTAKSSTTPKISPRVSSPPKSSRTAPRTPTTPTGSGKDGKLQKSKTPEKKPVVSSKTPDKKPAKKTSSTSLATSSGARASSKPRSASRPAVKSRNPPSPPQSGLGKPKPRSPTRPVQLPASLLAPTASSGSKGATSAPPARQTQSRASGAIKNETAPRSQSRAGSAPRSSATTAKSSHPPVSRSASQVKKGTTRPSLGPSSTLQRKSSAGSLPPASAPLADDGFLSRMMRPTASSASKSTDKSPPPKRSLSVKRPSSSLGHSKVRDTKTASQAIQKAIKPTTTKAAVSKSTAPVTKPGAKTVPKKKSTDLPKQEVKQQTKEAKSPKVEAAPVGSDVPSSAADETTETVEETIVQPVVEETVVEEKAAETTVVEEEKIEAPVAQTEVAVAEAEEPKKEVEAPIVPEPKEEVEVSEPAVDEAAPSSEINVAEQPSTPSNEIEAETEQIQSAPSSDEPSKVDVQVAANPEDDEDPEDAAARAEIARINAEMMAALNNSE